MNKIPTKNFRMNAQTKKLLGTILDPHDRGSFKRAMIQAQLHAEEQPSRDKRGSGGRDGGGE
jgi:hypothetical protein